MNAILPSFGTSPKPVVQTGYIKKPQASGKKPQSSFVGIARVEPRKLTVACALLFWLLTGTRF